MEFTLADQNHSLAFSAEQELLAEKYKRMDLVFEYNALKPSLLVQRMELLKQIFAEVGKNVCIESPFHSTFGGMNVHLGDNVFANFNLVLVDDADIYIGSHTKIGPNVTIATASHPLSPEERMHAKDSINTPVHIGENCWIGANVIILPGVTIGNNSVIGAGSIVRKNIPQNVLAVGNPCKVIRKINDDE